MQRCPNCHSQQLNGTIFCTECGGTLAGAAPPHQAVPVALPVSPAREELIDHATPSELRLSLRVLATGHVLRLPASEELLIGRKDEARGIAPDVDLGAFDGYDAGVSRRHAILVWHNGMYYVEDLGSANGTFVNGKQVAPQARELLRNGDELRCGMLAMRIEISP